MNRLADTITLSEGWPRFLFVLVAGAVSGLSVPPLFVLPALFVGLPVWIWALDGAEVTTRWSRLWGAPFQIGFGFGLGYFTVALHWLGAAFLQQGGAFVLLMPFAIVGLAAILSVFWGLASALAHALWSGGVFRLLSFAGSLALGEYARGHLFSGFPFDLVGYAFTANEPMMQAASLIGIYGVTVLGLLAAASPALIWPGGGRLLPRRLMPFLAAICLVAAQYGFGLYRLASTPVVPRSDETIRMVQPMILDHQSFGVVNPADIIGQLSGLSAAKLGPEGRGLDSVTKLVWPESVFPFFLTDYPVGIAQIGRMLPDTTLLLTGAPRQALDADGLPVPDNPGYNSILAIDHRGEVVASYDKSHLVPFGEYLPFASFWKLFGISQFVPGTNGWAPGEGRRLMSPPGSPAFLALVCYEAVFPGDIGDPFAADYILNVTNDAWFDGSIGPAQHAHHARLRAVESGLPLIRVANTGLTFATDPLGRVTASLPVGIAGAVDVVPAAPLPGRTLFAALNDLPFWTLTLGLIGCGAIAARRRHGLR